MGTLLSQARRVQLAFAMVDSAPCDYELVLRARPGLEWWRPMQWALRATQLIYHPPELLVLDDVYSSKWHSLPFGWRAGFPGSALCSVLFWRSVLVQQRDSSGFAWERIIKARLSTLVWCKSRVCPGPMPPVMIHTE